MQIEPRPEESDDDRGERALRAAASNLECTIDDLLTPLWSAHNEAEQAVQLLRLWSMVADPLARRAIARRLQQSSDDAAARFADKNSEEGDSNSD